MQTHNSKNKPNSLINSKSPYLLQHSHNPVDWQVWSKDVLDRAMQLNKPILLSIGYSSCHWCHVMERESFIDEEIARIMNDNFINIKVDREERPDIDHIYMDAVQLITGHGGWPLNCFLLPDTRPFWGGTYFNKNEWKEILLQISDLHLNFPDKLEKQAEIIQQNLIKNQNDFIFIGKHTKANVNIDNFYNYISNNFDLKNGGLIGAPKFPMPVVYDFLLNYNFFCNNDESINHILHTLELMSSGGIYDQLGGGFFRYSIDNKWKVPHFEKMLYDNAQLISLYSNAYKISKRPFLKKIIEETINFVETELKGEYGLYYSAIDADSEWEEGKFYIWNKSEIIGALGSDSDIFISFFQVDEYSKWENGYNILIPTNEPELIAKEFNISLQELETKISILKRKMLDIRNKRKRPLTDTKILLSWNSMLINAYIDAFNALGNNDYYLLAKYSAEKIFNFYLESNQLNHVLNYQQEENLAFLDDYAFFIEALLNLYQTDAEEIWLNRANKLSEEAISKFKKQNDEFLYYSDINLNKLFQDYKELTDNVIPSSNSTFMLNLYKLGIMLNKDEFKEISRNSLSLISIKFNSSPLFYTKWIKFFQLAENEIFTVKIEGNTADKNRKIINSNFIPNVLILNNNQNDVHQLRNKISEGDKTLIYICGKNSCYEPIGDIDSCIDFIIGKTRC